MAQSVVASMTHQSPNAVTQQVSAWPSAANSGMPAPVAAWMPMAVANPFPAISVHQSWLDDETRQAYMEATVEQDIAWQISINRKARRLTQSVLAERCRTKQSAIARLEDPTYGKHSIAMLVKVAHAFDCALRVKLIPYSVLAEEVRDTSSEALYVQAFSEEKHLIANQSQADYE